VLTKAIFFLIFWPLRNYQRLFWFVKATAPAPRVKDAKYNEQCVAMKNTPTPIPVVETKIPAAKLHVIWTTVQTPQKTYKAQHKIVAYVNFPAP
jgi:hypothetical protein